MLVATVNVSAQESVLLKLNYKKGDKFIIKTKQSVDSKMMGMNNATDMTMEVLGVEDGVITSETKVDKIVMDMMQAGMMMTYDTSAKEENVDEMGKMLKQQIDPMLKVVITSKVDEKGKFISIDVAPANIPSAAQFKNQATITFPEKALRVGDTWADESEVEGMTIETTYILKEIFVDKVLLTAKGFMSGVAKGTLTGELEIDRETGITLKSNLKTIMTAQGQEMTLKIKTSMLKL